MKIFNVLLIFVLLLTDSCNFQHKTKQKEIIIFHAGSLSVPFKKLAQEYEKKHPDIKIFLESSGSIVCARKVTELNKPCDIVASSDYFVINEMLIPKCAS